MNGQWYLVTDEYDSMAGHFDPLENENLAPLKATDEARAREEAAGLWAQRASYRSPGEYGSAYPKRPRVRYEVALPLVVSQ